MRGVFRYLRGAGRALLLSLLCSMAAVAQRAPAYSVSAVATGSRPMGIAITAVQVSAVMGSVRQAFAVVANSGDNSLSVFGPLGTKDASGALTLTALSPVTQVPSPYAAATCPFSSTDGLAPVLVTSPADNAVRVLLLSRSGGAASTLQGRLRPVASRARWRVRADWAASGE